MAKKQKFDLERWELDVYRKALMMGHWDDVAVLYSRIGGMVPRPLFMALLKDPRKGGKMEEIVLSEETLALVEKRSKEGCVSCGYILIDFKTNNRLTDRDNFPVEAKVSHVSAEKKGQV